MDVSSKIPPCDLDAETAMLGCVIFDNVAYDVAESLKPEHFYAEANATMWRVMGELIGKGDRVDAVTLGSRLAAIGQLEEIGGPTRIAKIMEDVPHASYADYYAKIIRDNWIRREIIFRCHDAIRAAYGTDKETAEVLQIAERAVFDVTSEMTKGSVQSLFELFPEVLESMLPDAEDGEVSTGFADLDKMTGKFKAGDLVILAARPAMGKALADDEPQESQDPPP